MSEKSKENWRWVRAHILNKYVIAIVIAVILLLFVGENNVLRQIMRERQYRALLKEKRELQEQNQKLRGDIQTLKDVKEIEKYGREHYYMHAENEDVYLIEDK